MSERLRSMLKESITTDRTCEIAYYKSIPAEDRTNENFEVWKAAWAAAGVRVIKEVSDWKDVADSEGGLDVSASILRDVKKLFNKD
jgi:hypothetical protein